MSVEFTLRIQHWWNDTDKGKQEYSEKKNCPNVSLSTTKPTQMGLRPNSCHRGEKPAINRLIHGTAVSKRK